MKAAVDIFVLMPHLKIIILASSVSLFTWVGKKNPANELLFLFVFFLRRVSIEVFEWNRLYL